MSFPENNGVYFRKPGANYFLRRPFFLFFVILMIIKSFLKKISGKTPSFSCNFSSKEIQ